MNPRLRLLKFHDLILSKLEAIERGELRNLVIAMPPRHGKTELVSNGFPAWAIGRNPFRKIIMASYGADLAERNSRIARNKLIEPRWPFPDVELAVDSAAVKHWGTSVGGEVLATGVEGKITGFGADILLIDDPFKGREEADSEANRRKVWNWFLDDASTRLQPNGAIVIVSTRWHHDDLVGRILASEDADSWEVLSLPAIAEEDEPLTGRLKGEALDPHRYPHAELLRTERRLGPRGWDALYQQHPSAEGGVMFKREWWRTYDLDRLTRDGLKPKEIVLDPAFGGRSTNDYSAMQVWGSLNGRAYLIDAWRGRVTHPELVRQIEAYHGIWKVPVVIEDHAHGRILMQELRSSSGERQAMPVIPHKIPGMASKTVRADAVTGDVEGGLVFLPEGKSWLEPLLDELCSFPQGAHDDWVDCMVMGVSRLRAGREDAFKAFFKSTPVRFG